MQTRSPPYNVFNFLAASGRTSIELWTRRLPVLVEPIIDREGKYFISIGDPPSSLRHDCLIRPSNRTSCVQNDFTHQLLYKIRRDYSKDYRITNLVKATFRIQGFVKDAALRGNGSWDGYAFAHLVRVYSIDSLYRTDTGRETAKFSLTIDYRDNHRVARIQQKGMRLLADFIAERLDAKLNVDAIESKNVTFSRNVFSKLRVQFHVKCGAVLTESSIALLCSYLDHSAARLDSI